MIEILKISLIAFMLCTIIQKKKGLLLWYKRIIKRLPWYLYMPLGGCYQCFVGQFCLWYYLITRHFYFQSLGNWIDFGFFVLVGIAASIVYNRIYCLMK